MTGISSQHGEFIITNNPQEFYCDALKFYSMALKADRFAERRYSCHAIISCHLAIMTFMDQEICKKITPVDPVREVHRLDFPDKRQKLNDSFIGDDIHLLASILDDVEFLNHLRNAIIHNKQINYTVTTSLSLAIFSSYTDSEKGRNLCITSTAKLAIETVQVFIRTFYKEVLKKPLTNETFRIDDYNPKVCF